MNSTKLERRQYPRFRVREGSYAFINNIPFTIQDISEGGMQLKSVVFDERPHDNLKVDIFISNSKFYIKGVPVRLINLLHDDSTTPFSAIYAKRFGFKFEELTEQQRNFLENLIANNTDGEA